MLSRLPQPVSKGKKEHRKVAEVENEKEFETEPVIDSTMTEN